MSRRVTFLIFSLGRDLDVRHPKAPFISPRPEVYVVVLKLPDVGAVGYAPPEQASSGQYSAKCSLAQERR